MRYFCGWYGTVCRTVKSSVLIHFEQIAPRREKNRQPKPQKRQPRAGGNASQRHGNGSQGREETPANATENAAKGGRKRQPKPWKGSQGREESASKAAEMAAVKLRREKILKKMSRGKFYASMLWLLFSCKNVPIILMYGSKSSFSAGFVPAGVDYDYQCTFAAEK